MDKKAILCELRTEVENMQQAMASILSKIELYQGMLEADEAVQQATVLQLKQQIATLKALNCQKAEVESQKSEVESQESEVKSQKSEVESQKAEVESECKVSAEAVAEPAEAPAPIEAPASIQASAPAQAPQSASPNHQITASPTKDARIITDLRKAIGLNDRFRLKHDLFNNNEALLFETIDALNAMSTFAEADAYLKRRFSWNADDATVVYFYEILQRKFV